MDKIELHKEAKQDAIEEITRYFCEERGEEISAFQAETFLEFFISHIGSFIYNQAIQDAYTLVSKKIEDIYDLEKRR